MREGLAERLMRAGLLTSPQANQARLKTARSEPEVAEILVEEGLDENALAGYYVAEGYGPLLNADDLARADDRLRQRLPGQVAHRLRALPVRKSNAGVIVAMATPSDLAALVELERHLGPVMPTVARLTDLRVALQSTERVMMGAPSISVSAAGNFPMSASAQSIVPLTRPKQVQPHRIESASSAQVSLPNEPEPSDESKGSHVRQAPIHPKFSVDENKIQAALQQLGREKNRDRIVEQACTYALQFGSAAIFLTVGKTAISGWFGAGSHVSLDAVRALRIPRSSPSMLRRVIDERINYGGPYGTAPVDQLLHSASGRRANAVYIVPVSVRSAIVGLLCVDCTILDEQITYWIDRIAERTGDALAQAIISKKKKL